MNIISDIWGSYSASATEHSGADIVDKLCDRVATSTLLEDRRDAVRSLRSLAPDYQVEVCELCAWDGLARHLAEVTKAVRGPGS